MSLTLNTAISSLAAYSSDSSPKDLTTTGALVPKITSNANPGALVNNVASQYLLCFEANKNSLKSKDLEDLSAALRGLEKLEKRDPSNVTATKSIDQCKNILYDVMADKCLDSSPTTTIDSSVSSSPPSTPLSNRKFIPLKGGSSETIAPHARLALAVGGTIPGEIKLSTDPTARAKQEAVARKFVENRYPRSVEGRDHTITFYGDRIRFYQTGLGTDAKGKDFFYKDMTKVEGFGDAFDSKMNIRAAWAARGIKES